MLNLSKNFAYVKKKILILSNNIRLKFCCDCCCDCDCGCCCRFQDLFNDLCVKMGERERDRERFFPFILSIKVFKCYQ